MDESCPQCAGRLIEKHEQVESEKGREVTFVFYRCVRCGKWVRREKTPADSMSG